MKLMKSKIIFSGLCLTAAISLAVFTVYAWFFTVKNVNTNGIDSFITTGDVISFKIEYFYTTSEDGKSFIKGDEIEKTLWDDSSDGDETKKVLKMNEYNPNTFLADDAETAVLLEMTIEFAPKAKGTYPLTANVHHSDVYDINSFNKFTEENYLSNVVNFWEANGSGNTYTINGDGVNFIERTYDRDNDEDKRESDIDLKELEHSEQSPDVVKLYFIMDYIPEQIQALYSIMLSADTFEEGAPSIEQLLTAHIKFLHDIVFTIGKA